MLMKGTSDDDSPVPGYLYGEITDLSYKSPAHCEFLLEFMRKRLEKNLCHVKFKTLKLMKHLVEKGDPAFRKGLQKSFGCIQDSTKFGGPPDPLHGNLPYQAVRQTAKELSAVLSEVDESQRSRKQLPEQKMVLGGLGPSASSSGGKYVGFGNTPIEKKSLGSTIREGIEKLADQLGETTTQRQAALMAQLDKNSSGDYVPPVVSPPPPSPAVVQPASPVKKVLPKSYTPGRPGGGWDTADDAAPGQHNSGTHSEGSGDLSDRLEAVSVTDWSAEEQLVTEYLFLDDTSQFILLRPSQLKVFKQKYQNLNCEKVVEFINARMQSKEDYVVVRALLHLETFLFRNDAVSLDYLVSVCQNQLNHLTFSTRDQRVIDKAHKIIVILEKYSSHPSILAPPDQSG
ncbi:hypothetical protein ACOMHN_009964 [Nucella lapillus]